MKYNCFREGNKTISCEYITVFGRQYNYLHWNIPVIWKAMYLLLIQIYEYGKYNFHGRVRYLTINLRFTGVHVHKTSPTTIYTLSLLVIYWLRFWMKTVHSTVYQLHLAKAFFFCFWMLQRSSYHVMFKYIKCKLTLNYSKIYILSSLLIWNYKFLRRPNSAVVLSPSGKSCTVTTEV